MNCSGNRLPRNELNEMGATMQQSTVFGLISLASAAVFDLILFTALGRFTAAGYGEFLFYLFPVSAILFAVLAGREGSRLWLLVGLLPIASFLYLLSLGH